MVVVPFGMVINLVVSRYDPDLVVQAMQLTGGVTAIMMMLGTMYPAFFKKIHGALTAALVAMIVVELVQIFFFKNVPAWTDWIVAGIFCGYIGYDWGRGAGDSEDGRQCDRQCRRHLHGHHQPVLAHSENSGAQAMKRALAVIGCVSWCRPRVARSGTTPATLHQHKQCR